MRTALWNAAKEPLRWLVLAVIPVVIVYLTGLNAQWAVYSVVVLRLLDKFIHELGKEANNDTMVMGLTRF